MSKINFSKAMSNFRSRLVENSPLEAPVRGFNRYSRDMSPATRELVLRARMPEIMAFSEDRRLDPAVVAGAVEASMRLGRIPDLGLYGLAGDEALAVKDFIATAMLGLEAEFDIVGAPPINESSEKHAKHKGFADHYRKLADHHTKAIEFHTQAAKKANSEGRPFSAAKHQSKIAMLKQLHASHAALADYHDCEAGRFAKEASAVPTGAGPTNVDQPTGKPEKTAHPAPGSTAAQRPEVPVAQKQEQTVSSSLAPIMKPIGSAFLRRSPIKSVAVKPDEDVEDESNPRTESRDGLFKRAPLLEDLLLEAKSPKKGKKKSSAKVVPDKRALGIKSDPDKVDKTIANVKCATLFHQLGHKMDHACAKLKRHKVKTEWADKLHKLCLSKGGSAAADEVVKSSLLDTWIRDQGFVDEASNLRHLWNTMMSAEADQTVSKASPTTPEPVVFTVNRMIDMAQGKGSVF